MTQRHPPQPPRVAVFRDRYRHAMNRAGTRADVNGFDVSNPRRQPAGLLLKTAQSSSPCGNVACCSSSRREYTFGKETKIAPDSSVPAAWASSLPEESRNESSTDLMSFGCSRSETSITITYREPWFFPNQ